MYHPTKLGRQLPQVMPNYPSVTLYYPILRGIGVTQMDIVMSCWTWQDDIVNVPRSWDCSHLHETECTLLSKVTNKHYQHH